MRVAVVQIDHDPEHRSAVVARAEDLLAGAADQGAELVLFPELFTTGYVPNFNLWHRLTTGAQTLERLQRAAKRFGLYVGTGHAEFLGDDVMNTFVVINASGRIEDRAIKANSESYIFRRGPGRFLLDTSLGRISVAICADNHFVDILRRIAGSGAVLHIMPHAWPTPYRAGGLVSQADMARARDDLDRLPVLVASALGVPTVFVNQLGRLPAFSGILGRLMSPKRFRLQGQSKIVQAGGTIIAHLGSAEGIAVADVAIGGPLPPGLPSPGALPEFDGWIHPGSRLIRRVVIPLANWRGQRVYRSRVGRVLHGSPPA